MAYLISAGRQVLTRQEVMKDVTKTITDIQVKATFPDGNKLVTVHQPII